jgi:hypothetical protein
MQLGTEPLRPSQPLAVAGFEQIDGGVDDDGEIAVRNGRPLASGQARRPWW